MISRRKLIVSSAAAALIPSRLIAQMTDGVLDFLNGRDYTEGGISLLVKDRVDLLSSPSAIGNNVEISISIRCPGTQRIGLFTTDPYLSQAAIFNFGRLAEPRVSTRIRVSERNLRPNYTEVPIFAIAVSEQRDGSMRLARNGFYCLW